MADFKVITLKWNGSLYDPDADPLISTLERALMDALAGDVVFLRASMACHDYHSGWLSNLSSKIYWEDLAQHFQRVHAVLVGMCLSNVKWIFISNHDCLGSWWDLALACQGRIWANPYAKVGFPEFYIDLFPPLGSLGLVRLEAYSNLDLARRNAILHAKDAFAMNIISLILQGDGWSSDEGLASLSEWVQKLKFVGYLRSSTSRDLLGEGADMLGLVENRSSLKFRRAQIASSHLEHAFSGIREKNAGAKALFFGELRAGGAARMLYEDYRAWLSRRISRYEYGSKDRWWTVNNGLVLIDIDGGVPPQSLIKTLLARKIHIVIIAKNDELLRDAVETILSRSLRDGGSRRDVLGSWRGRLDWIVGRVEEASGLWLRCANNDTINLGFRQTILLSRYRLAGNFGPAGLGWCEQLAEASPNSGGEREEREYSLEFRAHFASAIEIADMMTNGILRTQEWQWSLPLAVVLRYVMLHEMIRTADEGAFPGVMEQCRLLAQAGWSFAGDHPQWDALLRAYCLDPNLVSSLASLGCGSEGVVKITSLSEAAAIGRRSNEVSRLELSSARLSRHYESYAVRIGESLVTNRVTATPAMADLFMTLAWGYPGKALVPSELAADLGPGRTAEWYVQSANH